MNYQVKKWPADYKWKSKALKGPQSYKIQLKVKVSFVLNKTDQLSTCGAYIRPKANILFACREKYFGDIREILKEKLMRWGKHTAWSIESESQRLYPLKMKVKYVRLLHFITCGACIPPETNTLFVCRGVTEISESSAEIYHISKQLGFWLWKKNVKIIWHCCLLALKWPVSCWGW